MAVKDIFKSKGKIKIDKVFINKRTGQISIVLPKKQLKSIPSRVELEYW